MNPLNTRGGTVIAGIVLALAFIFFMSDGTGNPAEWTVWFHVVVGVAWIGLLYYFNAVQVPAVGAALADGDPGPAAINKYVAPRALFWFRWAALLTWLSGVGALTQPQLGGGMQGIINAFTFANGWHGTWGAISMGVWLGTIMLFNVWVLIWPNQKKLLGFTPATDEEKASAKKIAFAASRINTLLSFPMLLGMTAFAHGLPF